MKAVVLTRVGPRVRRRSHKRATPALTDGGRFVTTRSRRNETVEEMTLVRELLENGEIRAVIDRVYGLGDVPEAHRYVETGRKQGNVLVTIDHEGVDDV